MSNSNNEYTIGEAAELLGPNWQDIDAEAEQRWGDTPEWEQSQQAQQSMTADDWEAFEAESESFSAALSDAADRHVAPGSEEAAELVNRHLASISRWYEASREKQILLARMYVCDSRFDSFYGGHTQYLLELVEGQARKEGIDPDQAQWR